MLNKLVKIIQKQFEIQFQTPPFNVKAGVAFEDWLKCRCNRQVLGREKELSRKMKVTVILL